MKGTTFSEFYEKLYYGADIDLFYNGLFYHISTGYEMNNIFSVTVYEYDKHPDSDTPPGYYREIYSNSFNNTAEGIDSLTNAKIFDSKTLYQVENEMDIIYM